MAERTARGKAVTDETFQVRIAEARARIDELPEEQQVLLLKLLDETRQRHEVLKENFARTRQAVDEWRMLMKYLVFDREASMRERDDLRRRTGEA